ncbi:hypothetical protein HOLleu_14216 [Holothuria leucospilota]|uniref:Secreted protein n=1 Tax=Holothuria leucospilota TaxID=206669 RepID=A0A9Q1C788_HOLLE|nr:hypothetical protein HOLleu_14216 [Holothuria leucospilota]
MLGPVGLGVLAWSVLVSSESGVVSSVGVRPLRDFSSVSKLVLRCAVSPLSRNWLILFITPHVVTASLFCPRVSAS